MSLRFPKMGPGSTWPLALAGMVVVLLPDTAAAYVGPGAGLTMLAALWAVAAAILIALGGLLIWPIRAMLRSRKRPATSPPESPAEGGGHSQG